MAVKSQTINPAKNEGPIEPMKKTQTVNVPAKPATLIVAIDGSWTFHSQKYQGVVEWPENDERLIHAKGKYRIVGRK